MKKIAILSLHLGYGGIEKSVATLANILVEHYEVEIVSTYKLYEKPVFDIDPRVKIEYLITDYVPNQREFREALRRKHFFKAFKEGFLGFRKLFVRRSVNVSYIKNSDADIIIATRDIFDKWLGDNAKPGVVKIGWEHNHYHNDLGYANKIVRCSWKLDYLVLVSNNLRKFYSKELRNSKCRCVSIPNAIDDMPKRCASLKEKRLISVGRLSPEKGYIDLLKMYTLILKKHKDWHLDIIGDGEERERLESYIERHDLKKNITLHGFRDKPYIDKMLNKSSIYLMTSHTESFGIVLIEAMSHGLPCIAFSSAEGAREIIQSGKNGYLIKNRSYRAFIKKVDDLIKDSDTRKSIGRESKKSVLKYTTKVVERQWLKLLEKK